MSVHFDRQDGDPAGAVDLSSRGVFWLGPLEFRPSAREVRDGRKGLHVVEPRVMQVLVALADAEGAVLSRDTLVAQCWNRRVVGDDAISRAVAKARHVADLSTPPAFAIEAVARVGYRLVVREVALAPAASDAPPQPQRLPRPRTHGASVGLALSALALVAVVAFRALPQTPNPAGVDVLPFDVPSSDRDLAQLGREVREEIVSLLEEDGARPDAASPPIPGARPTSPSRGPQLTVVGEVLRVADRVEARATLRDRWSGEAIWTYRASQPWTARQQLREEVAATVGEAAQLAREPYAQPGLTIDPRTLGLYIRGALSNERSGMLRGADGDLLLAQVIQRAPQFAAAQGEYAMALFDQCDPATEAGRRACARMRSQALRAIALYPAGAGAAFDVLFLQAMQRQPPDFESAERLLDRGLASVPTFPFLRMRACIFQVEMGRASAGLADCDRGAALRPLGTPPYLRWAEALYADDKIALSERAYTEGLRRDPGSEPLRLGLTELEVFSGALPEAAAILGDPARRPLSLGDDMLQAMRLILRARRTGLGRDAGAALRAVDNAQDGAGDGPRYRVLAAGLFKRPDQVFAGSAPVPNPAQDARGLLFLPVTEPLRRDPRFWRLAEQQGLMRYWRAGHWPDFCRRTAFLSECRTRLGATPT